MRQISAISSANPADNEILELLVIFMEECSECSIEASKLIRFGIDSVENLFKLKKEVGDLLFMIGLLKDYGIVEHDPELDEFIE